MTHKSYHWQFCPMDESKPYDIFTEEDDVLVAVKKFNKVWGSISISSVRKVAETFHYEFEDELEGVS